MKHTHHADRISIFAGALLLAASCGVHAQLTVSDDFTQSSDPNSWKTFGGACLTAGNGTGSIPSCVTLPYYNGEIQVGGLYGYLGQSNAPSTAAGELPDPPGSGALRFTNGQPYGYHEAGAIVSSGTPFPTNLGVQITFKAVSYRGNSGNGDGADGMAFFLMDGSLPPYDVGAFGGSLGYSCSNVNNDATVRPSDGTIRHYDGLRGGYVGLGLDEYGNFLNAGDNTASGPNQTPGRIGLRGAGSVTWAALNATYPTDYPSTLTDAQRAAAVQNTCKSGKIWNYANASSPVQTATTLLDYPAIPNASLILNSILPGFKIANEAAVKRADGNPIVYNLKITQNGLLSLSFAYDSSGTYSNFIPVITNQSITASNGPLPSSFRFGFTGSTGGSNNVHEILCFQATPADLAGTSVGVNEKEATKIASGTQAYLAYYYPSDWTGRLTANNLLYTPGVGLSIATTANWDASCNLTGITSPAVCPSTLVGPVTAQAPGYPNRNMITWDPVKKQGVAFEWTSTTSGSAINATQQGELTAGDTAPVTADRLNYLRGVRTNEINPLGVGEFRDRDSVLGDIIDSSPTWEGPPNSPYTNTWKDQYVGTDPTPENTGQSYSQFVTQYQSRLNVVYNGANDGFLHGFESGSFDANGNYVNNATTPNDGKEVIAFMPNAVLQTIHNSSTPTQDFANAQYSHNYYVDATPDVDDLYYGNLWHSWLVGGIGPGGNAIYALDITDPTKFSESNAATVALGEWSSATISCANVANCGNNMGNTYGVPVIRRLHDGHWGVIFGNGFGSATGDAGIYVMVVDQSSGAIDATYYLSTGQAVGANDGIAFVAPADLDGDHITDYVYAGDLLGHLWRFDLTSGSETNWGVTAGGPMFTAPAGQPITTKPLVAITTQASGAPLVMVDFGTGRKFPQSDTTAAKFATGAQNIYGIWDWNLSAWNSVSSTQFASLTAPQSVTTANLENQYVTIQSDQSLTITNNPVCWKGSATCAGGPGSNTQYGFIINMPNASEQVVFSPILYQNAFIVNTTIPANNTAASCQVLPDTGDTIAFNVQTGGAVPGLFKNAQQSNINDTAGSETNGTGSPFIALAGGTASLLTQALGGGANNSVFTCSKAAPYYCTSGLSTVGPSGKRLTWIERR